MLLKESLILTWSPFALLNKENHSFVRSQNELEELPAHIAALTSLKRLAVSGNRLSKLPDTVAEIHSLRHLECAGNALAVLPAALGSQQPHLQHVCPYLLLPLQILCLSQYFVRSCASADLA